MGCNHSVVVYEATNKLIGDPMEIKLLEFSNFSFSNAAHEDHNVIATMESSYCSLNVYRRF